jgi:hypothetical protein
MRDRSSIRGRRFLTFVGSAAYVLFLIIAPFEHHDLACHIKSPQHCTSCSSNVVGADPHTPALVGACVLADAGQTLAVHVLADGVLLSVRSTGRSPPDHS